MVLGEICNAFFFIELMLRLWCTLGKNILARPGRWSLSCFLSRNLWHFMEIYFGSTYKDYTFGISRLGLSQMGWIQYKKGVTMQQNPSWAVFGELKGTRVSTPGPSHRQVGNMERRWPKMESSRQHGHQTKGTVSRFGTPKSYGFVPQILWFFHVFPPNSIWFIMFLLEMSWDIHLLEMASG